jgi:phospholipid/cholesterol/gamma-HCH transport system ATP-binding protein
MAGAADCFIEVSDLHKTLGSQAVLRGVNFDVVRGETFVILGRSGEGKSVLLKHLIGLMKPDRGSVKIEGQEISGLSERQLAEARRKVGVLFQNGALFDSMSVEQNVAFPLRERGERNRAAIAPKVSEVLEAVDMAEHKTKMPMNLSGGQRKRVALARAVIARPQCILYDEPTSGLDPIASDSIGHLIQRFQKRFGVTSVVITHDMKLAHNISDRIALLHQGMVHFLGTPDELQRSEDETVQDFVQGRSHDEAPQLSSTRS